MLPSIKAEASLPSVDPHDQLVHQMAGVIRTRLESLAEIVDTRKQMLAIDPGKVSGRLKCIPKRTTGNPMQSSARKNAMMERLFGPEEGTPPQEQVFKSRMQLKKLARKNARLRLEKQLQAEMEGHILRTVDSYQYRSQDTAMDSLSHLPTEAFLQYICKSIRLVKGRKCFRQFALSELSCGLFENESIVQKQELARSISKRYVELLQIFVFVCRILLGLDLCVTSVQIARKQYFPEDVLDEAKARAKWKRLQRQQSELGTSLLEESLAKADAAEKAMNEVMVIPHLARSISCKNIRPSNGKMLTKSASTSILCGVNEKSVLHDGKTSASVCWQTAFPSDIVHNRQARTVFDASQQSHLINEFLATPIRASTKPCFLLRTIPTKDCIVGGEATFRKRYNQLEGDAASKSATLTKECFRDLRRLRTQTRKELVDLDRERDHVLKGGKKAIQLYCATLAKLKDEASESIKPMDSPT
uniref:AlNc14C6G905 protein n=1 Tax=Albugo laibachii Nc14 TaxID=890382 RepID=F0W1D6_9STRA|nr:AlNc14C6G905 [Albugo laibachii Nc14]|eukprot:CCA14864.1 AlNc14C6G905 [Albugo laibachii Nc14]